MTCRARARSPRSAGKMRGWPGVGKVSARSRRSPATRQSQSRRARDRHLADAILAASAALTSGGSGNGHSRSAYGRPFSSSATSAWNTHGLTQVDSPCRIGLVRHRRIVAHAGAAGLWHARAMHKSRLVAFGIDCEGGDLAAAASSWAAALGRPVTEAEGAYTAALADRHQPIVFVQQVSAPEPGPPRHRDRRRRGRGRAGSRRSARAGCSRSAPGGSWRRDRPPVLRRPSAARPARRRRQRLAVIDYGSRRGMGGVYGVRRMAWRHTISVSGCWRGRRRRRCGAGRRPGSSRR